jgi:hypothetical protein
MANFKVKARRRVALPGQRLTVYEWIGRIVGSIVFMLGSALAIGALILAILYCYFQINIFWLHLRT